MTEDSLPDTEYQPVRELHWMQDYIKPSQVPEDYLTIEQIKEWRNSQLLSWKDQYLIDLNPEPES